MYYVELEFLIKKIIDEEIEKDILLKQLMEKFDCAKIYESDDTLVSDSYFSIKHYATGEETFNNVEWVYLLECLQGKRNYSIEEKMNIMKRSTHRQA